MTLLVRDEDDILASNLEFHLAHGVDFVIAMDNLSTDRTRDILLDYERRGVVHYLFQAEDNFAQHRWVTRMARLAATEFMADWVINSDVDEFWWPQDGDLKRVLSALAPSFAAGQAERTNFVPLGIEADTFFADVMTLREARSFNALGAPLPAKVCHAARPDVVVGQGNHSVQLRGRLASAAPVAIDILHFPVRSYAKFENKIAKGGAAYARNTELPPGVGITWRTLYRLLQEGGLRGYYDSLVPSPEDIASGLAEGRLIKDERLRTALRKLSAPDR